MTVYLDIQYRQNVQFVYIFSLEEHRKTACDLISLCFELTLVLDSPPGTKSDLR